MIPKRIIYTWFGNNELPLSFKKFRQTWIKENPNFEILRIDEKQFDVNFCAFTEKAYENKQYAFVSDVARIWAVNKYGGIYLDTDVELLHGLSKLINCNEFWAEESPGMVNSGLAFGSVSNSNTLKRILNIYKNMEPSYMEKTTTVKIISPILREKGLKFTNNTQTIGNDCHIYGPQYFAPFHYWGGGKITKHTMGIHHYNASWTHNKKGSINYLGHELLYNIPVLSKLYYD